MNIGLFRLPCTRVIDGNPARLFKRSAGPCHAPDAVGNGLFKTNEPGCPGIKMMGVDVPGHFGISAAGVFRHINGLHDRKKRPFQWLFFLSGTFGLGPGQIRGNSLPGHFFFFRFRKKQSSPGGDRPVLLP